MTPLATIPGKTSDRNLRRSAVAGRVGANLSERLDLSAANVDKANCVIKNVRILGPDSPNKHGLDVEGTDYLEPAHAQVRRLYEGMQVNIGHPPRNDPDAERHPDDRNGVLFNVKSRSPRETFADWKLIPSHPMTARLLECAADPQLHSQFAMSHNAKGYGHVREGRYQITEIPRVRSVDVVCNGGTNSSLFESQDTTMKKKFKDILEAASEKVRDRFRPLLEMYEELGDMNVEPPPAPAPGAVAEPGAEAGPGHMDHLGSLLKAIIDDVKSGHIQAQEAIDKILAAVKVMEETKESPAEEAVEAPEAEEEEDPKAAEAAAAMESKEKAELATLRAKEKVRDLCESLQFTPTPVQIKALIPLSEIDRKAFIKEQKALKPAGKTVTTPRTAVGGGRTTDIAEAARAAGVREIDMADQSPEAQKRRADYYRS